MFTLQLFGGCALVSNGETVTGPPAQRRRLALLSLLASSPSGVSRDKLVAFFWPDDDRERARHFLADSVFTLRKSLGKDAVLTTGDDVRVNPDVIASDVARFEQLAGAGELAEAVALYRGPFLDGFFITDAPELERWVERERDRLARRFAWCLEQLATRHESAGEWASAAEEWRRLAAHDPYNSRVALRTMRALDACGDVAGALRHAQSHQARVRDDLGLESDPAVVELADSVRSRSTTRVAVGARPSTTAAARPWADSPPAPDPIFAASTEARRARYLTRRHVIVPTIVALTTAVLLLVMRAASVGETPTGPEDRRTAVVASGDVPRAYGGVARTSRQEAADLYAEGRYVLTKGQFDPEIHRRALELFNQAVERDSSFAPAYAGMADVYNHSDDPVRAKAAALRAISLDSSLAEGYTALSYVLGSYEYRWAEADSALQRAIRLNPRYVLAHLRRANQLAAQGRLEEAEAAVERAREIQPESFVVMLNRGFMAQLAGRLDEAIARYQDALALEPGRLDAQHMLTRAYWVQGRFREAQGVMRSIGSSAGVIAMSGNPDTMAMIAPLLASSGHPDSISHAAAIYARLGRRAEAFELLERMYERRHKHLALLLQQQQFVSLRDDARFSRLRRKLNLP